MKPVRFDRHARKKMKDREVTLEGAVMSIREPEYTEPSVKGRTNAYRFTGDRFLRVRGN